MPRSKKRRRKSPQRKPTPLKQHPIASGAAKKEYRENKTASIRNSDAFEEKGKTYEKSRKSIWKYGYAAISIVIWAWGVFALYFQFYPKVHVSIYGQIRPGDPLSTTFILKNEGLFDIDVLKKDCHIIFAKMYSGGTIDDLHDITRLEDKFVALPPNKSQVYQCIHPSVYFENDNLIYGKMNIYIEYRPSFLWFSLIDRFGFETKNYKNHVVWTPWDAS